MTAKSVLPPLWEVPQKFRDRLGDQAGRQRAMLSDGHLLLVLHKPPHGDEPERKGRFFWRNPAGEWKASELRGGVNAVRMHLDEYAELLDQYDEQVPRSREPGYGCRSDEGAGVGARGQLTLLSTTAASVATASDVFGGATDNRAVW